MASIPKAEKANFTAIFFTSSTFLISMFNLSLSRDTTIKSTISQEISTENCFFRNCDSMAKSEDQIYGDKLRNAIMVIWLASKYAKNMSKSELRRISGYDSSGLYSAIESGWFREEGNTVILTEKAISYLKRNLLEYRTMIRTLFVFITIFPFINLLDWYLLTFHNINLVYNPLSSIASAIPILLIALNWYRIEWWLIKRKSVRE